ncbi:MAG: 30S ribosomal protein S16 [Ignavibacteria bacterium]|nr:30S ribosomal protein S16 [Ignavibacteria bacterium]
MVKLRLKRAGKKKKPVYKIVAADARSPRDGRFIEEIGYYDPNFDPIKLSVEYSRIQYWMSNGAKPTLTVYNLLKNDGILYKMYLEKKGKTPDEIEYEMDKFRNTRKEKLARAREKKEKLNARKKEKSIESKEVKEPKEGKAEPEKVKTEE